MSAAVVATLALQALTLAAVVVGWVVLYRHLTASDRHYTKTLRRGK